MTTYFMFGLIMVMFISVIIMMYSVVKMRRIVKDNGLVITDLQHQIASKTYMNRSYARTVELLITLLQSIIQEKDPLTVQFMLNQISAISTEFELTGECDLDHLNEILSMKDNKTEDVLFTIGSVLKKLYYFDTDICDMIDKVMNAGIEDSISAIEVENKRKSRFNELVRALERSGIIMSSEAKKKQKISSSGTAYTSNEQDANKFRTIEEILKSYDFKFDTEGGDVCEENKDRVDSILETASTSKTDTVPVSG